MFTKLKKLSIYLFMLALSLSLLVGCSSLPVSLPPEVEQAMEHIRSLPKKLDQLAEKVDELTDLLNRATAWLDSFTQPHAQPPEVPEASTFAVHFVDVGQADCTLVACDGRYMLIDGGNAEDSDLVYTYLKEQGVEHLDYLVATHLHEDHIGGLSSAPYAATIGTALVPETTGNTKVFKNLVKSLATRDVALTIPEIGSEFTLGSARVRVLGPVKEYSDTNNTSLVLAVDYGETTFLFTGDMEYDAEIDLVESGVDLSATVLKVAHHGSSSGTSYRFLREVMPQYAIISVGEGNSYGHPNEEVLSRLSDAESTLYRTDHSGTIIAHSDGTSVTFETER